jgi:hypothetical protein
MKPHTTINDPAGGKQPVGLLAMFERFHDLSQTINNADYPEWRRLRLDIPEEIRRLSAFAELGTDVALKHAGHLAGRSKTPENGADEPASTEPIGGIVLSSERNEESFELLACYPDQQFLGLSITAREGMNLRRCGMELHDTESIKRLRDYLSAIMERRTRIDAGQAAASTEAECAAKLPRNNLSPQNQH